MQMALKVHELSPDVCAHAQVDWVIGETLDDTAGNSFECGKCGKLMGDLDPGKPGWVDRLIKLWAVWHEAKRPGF